MEARMNKNPIVLSLFFLLSIKCAFAAPVLITLSEYTALSTSGVETIENFETFAPFNPFSHNLTELELSNGTFHGSDPSFTGGLYIHEEADGNQFLGDNGIDESQTFNLFPPNTTTWAADLRWRYTPDPGGMLRVTAISNDGSSTFFVGGNDCTWSVDGCPTIDKNIGFIGLYDPSGITSVSWLQYPGYDPACGCDTWTSYAYDNVRTVSAVPLPAGLWLFGSGLLGLVGCARRRA
jgi:hypothetical protein